MDAHDQGSSLGSALWHEQLDKTRYVLDDGRVRYRVAIRRRLGYGRSAGC